MSIKDQLKSLERQKQELLNAEKKKHLAIIDQSIAALAEIGIHYKLVEDPRSAKAAKPKTAKPSKPARRTGIRETVLSLVVKSANGITRAQLIAALGVKGDKKGEVSISNALATLKRVGQITSKDGTYRASKK